MKFQLVLPFSLATKALFDANYNALIAFDDSFKNPYAQNIWKPIIDDVSHLVGTLPKMNQNKEDTKIRNQVMRTMTAPLAVLEYKINACIEDNTITVNLAAFGLSSLRKGINKQQINLFHTSFDATLPVIQANQTALAAKGFTLAKTMALTAIHDQAWSIQQEKIALKENISDLSIENQIILNKCLDEDYRVINALFAMAEATSNKPLMLRATRPAILSSISPKQPRKPRNRTIKPASSIIIFTHPAAKDIIQLTLKSNLKLAVLRTPLKTTPFADGTLLAHNTLYESKITDLPGSGPYLRLFNLDHNRTATVLIHLVSPSK